MMNEILEGCMVAAIFLVVCAFITWLIVPKGKIGLPSVGIGPPMPTQKCKLPKLWGETPQNPLEPNPILLQKTDQEQRFDVVFDNLKELTVDTYVRWDELSIFLQRRHLDQIQIVCEELQELLPKEDKPIIDPKLVIHSDPVMIREDKPQTRGEENA